MPKLPSTTPRSFLRHPELFGRPGKVEWRQPQTPDEYAGLRAAELQHHIAVAIVERLDELEQTKSWLEDRSGLAAGRLSKLLRGHAQLTLRDIAALEGVMASKLATVSYTPLAVTDPHLQERFGPR